MATFQREPYIETVPQDLLGFAKTIIHEAVGRENTSVCWCRDLKSTFSNDHLVKPSMSRFRDITTLLHKTQNALQLEATYIWGWGVLKPIILSHTKLYLYKTTVIARTAEIKNINKSNSHSTTCNMQISRSLFHLSFGSLTRNITVFSPQQLFRPSYKEIQQCIGGCEELVDTVGNAIGICCSKDSPGSWHLASTF